jgi:hypothetical protein
MFKRLFGFKEPHIVRVDAYGPVCITHRGPEEGYAVHLTFRELGTRRNLRLIMPRTQLWQPLAQNLFHLAQRIDERIRNSQEREEAATARMSAAIERYHQRIAFRTVLKASYKTSEANDYEYMRTRTGPSDEDLARERAKSKRDLAIAVGELTGHREIDSPRLCIGLISSDPQGAR